ncbi:MAG: hypothetical protein H7245_23820 [Candidatus Saccharibacteria bacterium]|nr:hypothetical protein [Pseudorhodobacter sp.]
MIRDADIAALQKVDRQRSRANHDEQPAEPAALLPDHYAVYAPGYDMAAATPRDRKRRRQLGPMILSRWPILWTSTHLVPLDRMLDPLNSQTCALKACIATPGGPLRVIPLHLAHVGVQKRLAQIDRLMRATDPAQGGPCSGNNDEPDRNWTENQPKLPGPDDPARRFQHATGQRRIPAVDATNPYHPGAR